MIRAWRRIARRLSPASTERAARVGIFLFFLALFAAHGSLLQPLLQNGDSAVYNQQIDDHDLSHRSTHVGYFALGMLFNALLPFGTDLNMNVMLLVVGFLGLVALYFTAKLASNSRLVGLASVVLALSLPSQVRGMLLSEVDGVSVAFVAMAFACFVRGASLVAGLLFGFSVLVTPLSGPLLVLFLSSFRIRRLGASGVLVGQVKRLAKFGAGALLVFVPAVWMVYQDYVYGPRGLLHAPRSTMTVPQRIAHSVQFTGDELGYTLPLYAVAVVLCLASSRLWRAGQPALPLICSMAMMAVVGDRFLDVPVQLPNLVLLGILPAIAYGVSGRLVRLVLVLLFGLCFIGVQRSYAGIQHDLQTRQQDRNLCLAIRAESGPKAPVLVGISGFHQSRTFQRYLSSPAQPALVLEWRAFVRDQQRWLDPVQQTQIWFFRGVGANQVKRY
ncbi:MAG TPA: glycosyltransferase family 87 protein [Polyangiaceae bacterium]|nr:glycosyltransferase family 87 protein [Polyangiaceae bacterium]